MTISVTIKTHRWPALVTLTEHSEGEEVNDSTVADTLISGDSEQTFHIGHLAHLSAREIEPSALGPVDGDAVVKDDSDFIGTVIDNGSPIASGFPGAEGNDTAGSADTAFTADTGGNDESGSSHTDGLDPAPGTQPDSSQPLAEKPEADA